MRLGLSIAAVVVVALLGLLRAALLEGELLTGGLLTTYYYGHFGVIGDGLAGGRIPRWNPWVSNGATTFGPRGGGVVYPANLLFAVLPLAKAFALYLALHLALAIEGARRLARRDASTFGALVAGLAYGLGGFVLSMYGDPIFVVSAAWLPWAALGGATIGRGRERLLGTALVGGAIALCLLASEQQGAVSAALVALAFAVGTPGSLAKRRASALLATLGVAIGLAAAGTDVVSTLALFPDTERALSPAIDSEFPLAPIPTLLDLLVPGVMGMHSDASGGFWVSALGAPNLWCVLSVGTVGVGCVAAAAESRRRSALGAALALVALGAALAAFGVGGLVSLWLPNAWLVISALGLARLVGLGAEVLVARRGRFGPLALHGLAIAGLLGGAAFLFAGAEVEGWLGDTDRVDGAVARLTVAQALLRGGLLASLGLLLLHLHPRIARPRRAALWLGLILLDLLTANAPLLHTTSLPLLERPPVVATVTAASGSTRPDAVDPPFPRLAPRAERLPDVEVAIPAALAAMDLSGRDVGDLFYREVLGPNVGALHGVRTIGAFQTSRPRALAVVLSSRSVRELPPLERLSLLDAALLLGDVRYLPVLPDLDLLDGASPATPTIVLARNRLCPPWAYLESVTQPLPNLASALAAVCEGAQGVVLGPEGPLVEDDSGPKPTSARLVLASFEAEEIVFDVRTDAAVWLVVREAYSDDWVATIDGSPATTARADVLYRAVHVPPGAHRVVFAYAPGWWAWAVGLTTAGWLVLGACGLRGLVARRR